MADVTWPSRYELLDGLRGLAALAVLLYHIGIGHVGHFAVMVFFVISGYCITASAHACRLNGLGLTSFLGRRVRRIYPPYLLAVAFFAVTRAVKFSLGGSNELNRPLLTWLQNLTLTQWVSDLFHPAATPADNPTLFVSAFWSLNYEEQFYLVMALFLAIALRARIPLIISVTALALVGLVWNWLIPGNWICGLCIEYWPHFALGSGLFFVLCETRDRRTRLAFLCFTALLGISCAARLLLWTGPATDLRAMQELAILSAVTLALFFARPLSAVITASRLWRPIAALGVISYSLYLIHQFNLNLVGAVARYCLPSETPQPWVNATIVALHLVLASAFWYCCERPFLRQRGERRGNSVSKATSLGLPQS
jgi:peptidoglycan/LPS O-acetylase OafA/YrhL